MVTILNDKLKKLRKDKNLTQQEVANKLGISRARWEHWEIGRTEPSFDYKIKIAKLFECDIGYLLNNSKIVMVEGESDVTLFNSIMRLSKNKIEEELLVKCTMLTSNHQEKLLELVNLYLKEQGDYYIYDKDKWKDSSDNNDYNKKEYDKIIKEINDKK